MATVYTCKTPKEAWSLCSHFLGNLLTAISLCCENETDTTKKENTINHIRARLIGNLYVLVRKMKENHYSANAENIQKILDMVIDQDVTNEEVREAIHSEYIRLSVCQDERELQSKWGRQSPTGM